MAATAATLKDLSTTAASNGPSGSADPPSTLDDSLRNLASMARYRLGTHGSIASAATCDIGTKEERSLAVTGTTGISSFGTSLGSGGYGIVYELTFDGILTLTNSASLACISSADITTAAGDSCAVRYSSTGWTMLWYSRKDGRQVSSSVTFADGTVGAPAMTFASDLDNGWYRIGANNWAGSVGGTKVLDLSSTVSAFTGAFKVTASAVDVLSISTAGAFTVAAADNVSISCSASSGKSTTIAGGSSGLTLTTQATAGTAGGVTVRPVASSAATGATNVVQGGPTSGTGYSAGGLYLYGGDRTAATGGNDSGDVFLCPGYNAESAVGSALGKVNFQRVTNTSGTRATVWYTGGQSGIPTAVDGGGMAVTLTSGWGTGATVKGNAKACRITFGTSAGTTCVLTMPADMDMTDVIVTSTFGSSTANIAYRVSGANTSGVNFVFASAPASGDFLMVHIEGYQ